jgi:ATP synthase protein I
MKQRPPSPSLLAALGALSGMGFTIAVPIIAGALFGDYLDALLHTGHLLILLGLLLGLISGIWGAFRLYKSVFH